MKEKKNVKKDMQQVDEIPSKGKIITAWIMLIVLSACTAGLVYLKNFSSPVEEDQNEIVNNVSPVIKTALTDIVDKFNAGALVSNYRDNDLVLSASLKDTTITIIYTNNDFSSSVDYIYNVAGNLTTVVNENDINIDIDIMDKIFKAIVIACRDRLDKEEDISSQIDTFISEGTELYGLKKENLNGNITYYVDIRYPGFAPEVDTNTSNTDTSSDQVDNSNVEDNQNENPTVE